MLDYPPLAPNNGARGYLITEKRKQAKRKGDSSILSLWKQQLKMHDRTPLAPNNGARGYLITEKRG